MDVQFPGPLVPAQDGGLSVRAIVDGSPIACHFSMEALQDVNPALTEAPPTEQFEASRERLLSIAESKIRSGAIANGVVHVRAGDV